MSHRDSHESSSHTSSRTFPCTFSSTLWLSGTYWVSIFSPHSLFILMLWDNKRQNCWECKGWVVEIVSITHTFTLICVFMIIKGSQCEVCKSVRRCFGFFIHPWTIGETRDIYISNWSHGRFWVCVFYHSSSSPWPQYPMHISPPPSMYISFICTSTRVYMYID